MPSQHYNQLKKQVTSLRRHLLPSKFDSSGQYRERVFTGVIAFRVLCHAAIEDYIEERVISIAVKAASHCKNTNKISEPAAHIASFGDEQFGLPPETLVPPQSNQQKDWPYEIDLVARICKLSGNFVGFVKRQNHGIREKNLLRLLITIGLRHDDIDPVLVSELDNFGKLRGEVAHSSTIKHIRTCPNPEDELNRVNNLVSLLRELDRKLDKLILNIDTC